MVMQRHSWHLAAVSAISIHWIAADEFDIWSEIFKNTEFEPDTGQQLHALIV